MFTGLIQKNARVVSTKSEDGMRLVSIEKPSSWALALGGSVSIDGICATVVRRSTKHFDVEFMPETLRKTTAGGFERGTVVNLELPMRFGDKVDGHFVQGHIDGTGRVESMEKEGASRLLTIRVPAGIASSIALRGSAAINGVSLTVARRHGPHVSFALIPHTIRNTNLGLLKKGHSVNIETDRGKPVASKKRGGTVKRHATKKERKKR
jgi:riboflavin synthase